MRYYYPYVRQEIGMASDRKTRIIIPDFEIEMEFIDGGKYSSYSIIHAIAEYKLKDTIWCYLNDKRELPVPSSEEFILDKYDQSPLHLIITIDDGNNYQDDINEEQFKI